MSLLLSPQTLATASSSRPSTALINILVGRFQAGKTSGFRKHQAICLWCQAKWLAIEDKGAHLLAICELPEKQKEQLATHCVARILSVDVRGANSLIDQMVSLLGIDSPAYWQPTKDNSIGRMTKQVLAERFAYVTTDVWKIFHTDSTKKLVVESLSESSADDDAPQWVSAEF